MKDSDIYDRCILQKYLTVKIGSNLTFKNME